MSILSDFPFEPSEKTYHTPYHMHIRRQVKSLNPDDATQQILTNIDHYKGALFSSSFEYTGRYTRWDVGFINPPIELRSAQQTFQVNALNQRGEVLLDVIYPHLASMQIFSHIKKRKDQISGVILYSRGVRDEAERTKQRSVFDVLRALQQLFHCHQDRFLGLYGAFGYDLVFQFEPLAMQKHRDHQNDLHLYMPDELIVVDHKLSTSYRLSYDFYRDNQSTEGMQRTGVYTAYKTDQYPKQTTGYEPGYYANLVRAALPSFQKGDLYEAVPTQVLYKKCPFPPSAVFENLKQMNPSPYGFIINLGEEFLVGSSPEMYVRVDGNRVETCPISGTIRRGQNAVEDAENVKTLLDSVKDEAELTMCTDVDRNDKSRICKPGSVKVIGRRQIEAYSHLFHTVDHIEGELDSEYDALDAFITHMWAVTVTGAPKTSAMRWIEEHEECPRGWYGGAVGWYSFDGNLNTGLVLRTTKIKNGVATLRAGATLLHASNPEDEEKETLVKIAALSKAMEDSSADNTVQTQQQGLVDKTGRDKNVLLIDHEDSFVHTLANYLKQAGAQVKTVRAEYAREMIEEKVFDLTVLSPGPGRPERFHLGETIDQCVQRHIPVFGVCLGFQGMAEYFGGALDMLPTPCHGTLSEIQIFKNHGMFENLGDQIKVGRYHSLFVRTLPECFEVTAQTKDGVTMAARHRTLPVYGVQFHPESIYSSYHDVGLQLIRNVIQQNERVSVI